MTDFILGPWQQDATDQITKHLRPKGGRAALLQLPTGFGKSLVAIRLYQNLRRKVPGLRLAIVVPKQLIAEGWKKALSELLKRNYDELEKLTYREIADDPDFGVLFCTRRDLKSALLNSDPAGKRLARKLTSKRYLIVVDEFHRLSAQGGISEALHSAFMKTKTMSRKEAERSLSPKFRAPKHGRRRWPQWVLLSATPINPVSLDRIDPLDEGTDVADERPKSDEFEVEELRSAAERIYAALAHLNGDKYEEWFHTYIKELGTALKSLHEAKQDAFKTRVLPKAICPPPQLAVYPIRLRTVPRTARRRTTLPPQHVDLNSVDRAIEQVVINANALAQLQEQWERRWTMTERVILSGGMLKVSSGKIEGEIYSPALVRSVSKVVKQFKRIEHPSTEKLSSLIDLVGNIERQHILIFCSHRAVANSVVRHLQSEIGQKAVKRGQGTSDPNSSIVEWFNESSGQRRVLVTTDAWSESIDLHKYANILFHYEMPWSPLRVLQRVGRLWRIREGEVGIHKRPTRPHLPAVCHFAHPGSADEEIVWRLKRRWGYLRVLGLNSLTFDQAMGVRIPAVPPNFSP